MLCNLRSDDDSFFRQIFAREKFSTIKTSWIFLEIDLKIDLIFQGVMFEFFQKKVNAMRKSIKNPTKKIKKNLSRQKIVKHLGIPLMM
jgi:hypothetical protein